MTNQNQNRELEIKYRIDLPHNVLKEKLDAGIKWTDVKPCGWVDYYYPSPGGDFVRLRHDGHERGEECQKIEITVKHTDKGSITDRKEVNIPVDIKYVEDVKDFLNTALGDPILSITREATVYTHGNVLFCLTDMGGPEQPILEIESLTGDREELSQYEAILYNLVGDRHTVKVVKRSMFELALENQTKGVQVF